MYDFPIHQLRCFDAVVRHDSFQAAAVALNKTHPTVHTAVKMLEARVGVILFDRSGYRVKLTPEGQVFHRDVQEILAQSERLSQRASQLREGEESELSLVIGDIAPVAPVLERLNRFFRETPQTRLNLHFEALSGPIERLLDGEADIIIHYAPPNGRGLERAALFDVSIVPVVAPGFLDFPVAGDISPEQMAAYPQCVIRDTAQHSPKQDHFLIEGARQWVVGDQHTKKEIILQGMGWGHMPDFMIGEELANGELLPISGRHFPGAKVEICALRRRDAPVGPVATRLWQVLQGNALQG
ncbi:LysR family transcriptional regulator [Profundibacter sp.]|uniref:LysR family transcriptional regulator n=1 Tax=Profundibacter sp. TaxID=3101071 RepID=UPI003D0EFCC3